MALRVVDAFEVIEIEQEQGVEASAAADTGSRSRELVLHESSIRQPRDGIVESLTRELSGEFAFFGDVTFGEHEIRDIAIGVARGGAQNLHVDDLSVLSQVALDVARMVDFAAEHALERRFGESEIIGVRKRGRSTTNEFIG